MIDRRQFLKLLAGTGAALAVAPYLDPMEEVRRLWPGFGGGRHVVEDWHVRMTIEEREGQDGQTLYVAQHSMMFSYSYSGDPHRRWEVVGESPAHLVADAEGNEYIEANGVLLPA